MRALKARACIAAALLLPAAAAPAMARERLVVLMVADADPALADDLTEVAIATLAERRIASWGNRELRARLAGVLRKGASPSAWIVSSAWLGSASRPAPRAP